MKRMRRTPKRTLMTITATAVMRSEEIVSYSVSKEKTHGLDRKQE